MGEAKRRKAAAPAADEIRFDVNDWTLGEVEAYEGLSGGTVGAFLRGIIAGGLTSKQLRAAYVVVARRTNPNASLEDAKGLRLGALRFGPEQATRGEGRPPVKAPASSTT